MTSPATQIGAGNPSLPVPCSHSDYLWLIRQVEADKWPLLYAGVWLSEASVLDILARYEATDPEPVCADCGRDLPPDGYCQCTNAALTCADEGGVK